MNRYRPASVARHSDVNVRGLRYRLHSWGDARAPLVLLLHGWADTGMSFQFLAEHMHHDWHLVAPDWRGFGDSEWAPGGYWFPDYLADLEILLDETARGGPARIVGHSMGGNVAWLYAGTRPDRMSHVVSLDAFGLPDSAPDDAPDRYRRWLDEWRVAPAFSVYEDADGVIERVKELAPQMDTAAAAFIAGAWSRTRDDGRVALKHDPRHKSVNPILYRRAEARACWRRISAHTLLVLGKLSRFHQIYFAGGGREECRACIPHLEESALDCGHMLHLERPGPLAGILDAFLKKAGPRDG